MKTLFKNATILTMNKDCDVLCNHDVLVEDTRIKQISKNITTQNADRVIDCDGKILMPGFVNAHFHSADPYNDYMTLVKRGITTVFDINNEPERSATAMKQAGIRGLVGIGAFTGRENLSSENLDKTRNKVLEANSDVKIVVWAKNIFDVDERDFETLIMYAKKHDLLISTHCSETLEEVGECATRHNDMSPIALLEYYGFLNCKSLLVHCVHCDKEDVEILKYYDTAIVSCPSGNLVSASGVAPLYSYTKNNILLALGTDHQKNNGPNMFKEMFLAKNLQSAMLNEKDIILDTQAVKMATCDGAKALGLDDCGSIEEGKLADIILLNINSQDPHNTVVSNANIVDIAMTMINGNVLYENKVL